VAILALALAARSSVGLNIGPIVLVAAVGALVFSFLFQVWIASIQIRRFLHWFGGTPDGDEKLAKLFDVYGWRARLAVRLFGIQLPPGFLEGLKRSNQAYPMSSGVESVIVALVFLAFLLLIGTFTYLMTK
jgi:hypothetical protein